MKKTVLPNLLVQSDWNVSVQKNEKFWVSCIHKDEKIFSEFICEKNKIPTCKNSIFEIKKLTNFSLDLRCTKSSCKSSMIFKSPITQFSNIHANNKPIEYIDISPEGELGVSGSRNGSLRIWETKGGKTLRDLEGHVGDIYCCKFLPSGKVVMSSAADYQIKIWRIADSRCAVTLKGHKGGILRLSFIDKGRNFISCSRDRTVKLWDCASQSVITTLYEGKDIVNDCVVVYNNSIASNEKQRSKKEFNTSKSVVLLCTEDKKLECIDVTSRKSIFSVTHKYSLNTCMMKGNLGIVGSVMGEIIKFDVRNTKEPLSMFMIGKTPVLSMGSFNDENIFYTTQEGNCMLYNLKDDTVGQTLVGSNLDPLYCAKSFGGKFIYTSCRDGIIRKYIV